MPTVEEKRAAAIEAKEKERKEKNGAIAADKKAKAAGRAEQKSAEDSEAAEAAKKKAEIDAKREANIANKGKKKESSKYSKKDVFELKAVFDTYDRDGSGKISAEEFRNSLEDNKKRAAPKAGEKSTLEQRKAAEGVSIMDLSEGVFAQLDVDGDGEVTFAEMLKLMFRHANANEIEVMLSWVAPEPEPEPEPKAELSKEAKAQINQIFKLYDKDKSGTLTVSELRKALEKTGIEPDEIQTLFKEYDTDGNKELTKDEFSALMESTGAFDDI